MQLLGTLIWFNLLKFSSASNSREFLRLKQTPLRSLQVYTWDCNLDLHSRKGLIAHGLLQTVTFLIQPWSWTLMKAISSFLINHLCKKDISHQILWLDNITYWLNQKIIKSQKTTTKQISHCKQNKNQLWLYLDDIQSHTIKLSIICKIPHCLSSYIFPQSFGIIWDMMSYPRDSKVCQDNFLVNLCLQFSLYQKLDKKFIFF